MCNVISVFSARRFGSGTQGGDADKRKGLMSMAYADFAALMADVEKAFKTWDKVMCNAVAST